MKLVIDDVEYDLPLAKLIEAYRALYKQASENGIQLANGKSFNIGDRSVLRTGIKAMMTPVVIPIINDLYRDLDAVLQPPIKHEDLIDYTVNAFLDALLILEDTVNVYLTSTISENSGNAIESFAATRTKRQAIEEKKSEPSSSEDT